MFVCVCYAQSLSCLVSETDRGYASWLRLSNVEAGNIMTECTVGFWFVCLFLFVCFCCLAVKPPITMLVYLGDGPAQTTVSAATLRDAADQTFYLSQSQYTDTGPSIQALTL